MVLKTVLEAFPHSSLVSLSCNNFIWHFRSSLTVSSGVSFCESSGWRLDSFSTKSPSKRLIEPRLRVRAFSQTPKLARNDYKVFKKRAEQSMDISCALYVTVLINNRHKTCPSLCSKIYHKECPNIFCDLRNPILLESCQRCVLQKQRNITTVTKKADIVFSDLLNPIPLLESCCWFVSSKIFESNFLRKLYID